VFFEDAGPDPLRRRFTRRAWLLGGLQGVCFAALAARLYELQIRDGRVYAPLADDNRITMQGLPPLRGRIFDRRGRVLADDINVFQARIIPALTPGLHQTLEAFSEIHPLSQEDRERILKRARLQSKNLPILLADDLDWNAVSRINIAAAVLPGVTTVVAGHRHYSGGIAMGHLTGHTGPVARYALDDDPVLRLPGFRVGKTGLEAGLDGRLRGRPGWVRREVNARGHVVRELDRREPVHGHDVAITIDRDIQESIRQRLKHHRCAAAVVLHADTGEIAAMVSVPGYDPAVLDDGISHADWRKLARARDNPLLDRTVQGQYAPGSTFKMVTALAALEAGVISPRDVVRCPGYVELAGTRFRCWNRSGHGDCSLHRGLRESCDVYFYTLARRTGSSRIAEMGRTLGLGQTFAIGLDAQEPGLLPDPDWKRGRYGKPWFDGETLLAGIGQGYVLTTPMQLAVMTARLATGRAIVPTLTRPIDPPSPPNKPLPISVAHMARVRRAMSAVVNEPAGTGRKARAQIAGVHILGKTGTSQVTRLSSQRARDHLPWHLRDHSLFVGAIADDRPRYVAAVIVEHAGSGGKVAAPLARDILTDVFIADPASRPPATSERRRA
jgi:penicillin-binding protein 2